MIESLATERHVQFSPKRVQRDFEELVAWVKALGMASDPVTREQLADIAVDLAETHALSVSLLDAVQHGRNATVEAAFNKLAATDLCQRIARAALDLGAPESLVKGTMIEFLWRQSICETIGGGTSEVMRGVIARARLGLVAKR